jgi:hypothetical protein
VAGLSRPCSTHALNALAEQATPGELDKVADQARVLREWFRGFVRKHMERPLTPKATRELGPRTRFWSVMKCSAE